MSDMVPPETIVSGCVPTPGRGRSCRLDVMMSRCSPVDKVCIRECLSGKAMGSELCVGSVGCRDDVGGNVRSCVGNADRNPCYHIRPACLFDLTKISPVITISNVWLYARSMVGVALYASRLPWLAQGAVYCIVGSPWPLPLRDNEGNGCGLHSQPPRPSKGHVRPRPQGGAGMLSRNHIVRQQRRMPVLWPLSLILR